MTTFRVASEFSMEMCSRLQIVKGQGEMTMHGNSGSAAPCVPDSGCKGTKP
jgi:hypothetical protein